MDRLSLFLSLAVGAVVTGGLIIVVLSLGFYSWQPIVAAGVLGFVLSWPAAYWTSRRIKRSDPEWDHTRIRGTSRVPRPSAPEV